MQHSDHLLQYAYLLTAGGLLLVGIQHALFSRSGYRRAVYLNFSLLSFCAAGLQLSGALLYTSQDVLAAAGAVKLQAAMTCCWSLPFYLFLCHLTGVQPKRMVTYPLAALVVGLLVINALLPYGVRYSSMERTADLVLPWGETIAQYAGELGAGFRVGRLIVLALLIWGAYRATVQIRGGQRRDGIALLAGCLLIFAGGIWGKLIDTRIIDSFYVAGFAFLAMVCLMSASLARAFKNLTKKNQEQFTALKVAAATFETDEAIMVTDAQGIFLRVNKAFQRITGFGEAEVIGQTPRILRSGRHDRDFYVAMWKELLSTGQWAGEVFERRKDGSIFPASLRISMVDLGEGQPPCFVGIVSDLSLLQKSAEDFRHLAHVDSLTGLPNRRAFNERLLAALSRAALAADHGALVILDLDKFSTVNESLGHDYGDVLLMEVAHRLVRYVGERGFVARLGADEFALIVEGLGKRDSDAILKLGDYVENIRTTLSGEYQVLEHARYISSSFGVVLFCDQRLDNDELLKRALAALSVAKDGGRNVISYFDSRNHESLVMRARLESELRQAIKAQQLALHYQVQVDGQRRPIGAEALIRWIHPERGMVSPAEFIPIAEAGGMIVEIGQWVLNSGCRQLKQWSESPETNELTLAVNISAEHFGQPDFVEQVKLAIAKTQINPTRLKLELTESLAMNDMDAAVAKMRALRAELGVKLALDDFGTGYSSLSYLKRMPLDQIKIDQGFVRHVTSEPRDAVMVKAIIDLARNFGFSVIAEGVESEEHVAFLQRCGCEAYQGYLFGKPVPIGDFAASLARLGSPKPAAVAAGGNARSTFAENSVMGQQGTGQLGQGERCHLFHDSHTASFEHPGSAVDRAGNLLVQLPGNDPAHDFALMLGQFVEAVGERIVPLESPGDPALEGAADHWGHAEVRPGV